MAVSVKLPKNLVENAKRIAKVNKVSVSKQIEFYFRMAALAEENSDLPYAEIRQTLSVASEGLEQ